MERQVSYSVANFAAKFCNELGTNKTSICSPLSAEILLALLALGCKNESHEELLKALNMPDDKTIRSSYTFLTSTLKSVRGVSLNVANKVYVTKGAELKPGIKKDAKNVFQASLKQLDFDNKEAAANTINNWVAQKTNNKIKDIVTRDTITENTAILLVNAIYFQGVWAKKFTVSETKNSEFYLNETTTISVPMMWSKKNYFNYGESKELGAELLQMKYKGSDASMIIVLPDEVEGLKSVLQKLASGHDIMADIETMKRTKIDVMIPKWRVETTIDLKTVLPNLGIKSIFDNNKADIDMLKSNEDLFVSDAIQKALIIVNENGTEAAVATAYKLVYACAELRKSFYANRPFLYFLTVSKIVLFSGIYEGSEYADATYAYEVVEVCDRIRKSFYANRPFLYFLTVSKILLFIGIYEGSEYAAATCGKKDITASQIPGLSLWEQAMPVLIKMKNQTPTHDSPTHDTHTHHTPIETHRTSTSPLCARCEIQ